MNLLSKTFYSAALLLAASASAEFTRQDGHWQVKAGTTPEITPAERLTVVLIAMDIASSANDAGEQSAALKSWVLVAEANHGNPAEALAMLEQARIYTQQGRFEMATELIDAIYARHSSFSKFQEAVQLQFEIANRIGSGERRYLGGWFPWFKDPASALTYWQKTLRLAPNGPLADQSLIKSARLAIELEIDSKAEEALERLVSDYPSSKFLPEALEALAKIRAHESMGADWDQASTIEAADHWRTLADQFPNDKRTKQAPEQIRLLRDRAARARLNLAKFYWLKHNNPEAAKLMANSCLSLAPESQAAKEAEALLAEIQKNPTPPKTIADRLLGTYPRPRMANEATPTTISSDLDSLGFKKETPRTATETERR
ncbi:MAG: outer membrane protein assembly factor BamD [Verrucomicrobia bacterium]|nr:outer membrane protein assembly factor BamD [Verrucomicrobiota bacterium]